MASNSTTRQVCSVLDCNRGVYAKLICHGHYKRLQRYGDVRADRPLPDRNTQPCKVTSCDSDRFCRGYCDLHYRRSLRTNGDPLENLPKQGFGPTGKCSVESCGRSSYRNRDYCNAHQGRFRAYGDPMADRPLNTFYPRGKFGPLCLLEHCEKEIDGNQPFCAGHLQQSRKYNVGVERLVELYARSDGKCYICREEPGTSIDHDHSCCTEWSCGNCVRGVLCSRCNSGLGYFRDSPRTLVAAANYLSTSTLAA